MKNFCITFHYMRCGSTALASTLAKHPDVAHAGELFNWASEWNIQPHILPFSLEDSADLSPQQGRELIDNFLKIPANKDKKSVFLELTLWDITRKVIGFNVIDFTKFMEDTFGVPVYILHLYRKNLLKRFLSSEMAAKTGVYHSEIEVSDNPQIKIDIERLLVDIDSIKYHYQMNLHNFSQHPRVLDLFYEDDIEIDVKNGAIKALDFVGLDVSSPHVLEQLSPSTKKIINANLQDVIKNFKELKDALGNKNPEWLL